MEGPVAIEWEQVRPPQSYARYDLKAGSLAGGGSMMTQKKKKQKKIDIVIMVRFMHKSAERAARQRHSSPSHTGRQRTSLHRCTRSTENGYESRWDGSTGRCALSLEAHQVSELMHELCQLPRCHLQACNF
jgi:hypothetical protein